MDDPAADRTTHQPNQLAAPTEIGRSQPCPRCGSTSVARIAYGLPAWSETLDERMKAGEVRLGGCMPGPYNLSCNACDQAFGRRVPEPVAMEEVPSAPDPNVPTGPGWECPLHGGEYLRSLTSRRGRRYRACTLCMQFEHEPATA